MALPHLNSDTLLFNFGVASDFARDALRALWKQLIDGESEFTKILYSQWRELFALAVEFSITDQPGEDLVELFQMGGRARSQEAWDEAVFIVHTYYSLLLKILAIRIVDELGLAGRVSLLTKVVDSPVQGMIEAERMVPEILGNVIEKDIFSWPYCDEKWPPTTEVSAIITEMAIKMGKFDVRGINTDVLRRVYQNVIPPKLRKSLGEFYTPTWAAELLLDEIGYEGKGRILDPACGSGTFLVAAITRVLYFNPGDPQSKLTLVSENVVGFDLNPIAVATARLNFILALVDTISSVRITKPLSIPVYLSDSILFPEIKSVGLLPHFKIPTRVGIFKIPILIHNKIESEIVEDTKKILYLLRNNCTRTLEEFLQSIRKEFGPKIEEENRVLLSELHKMIYTLHIEDHDGIWTSIIENFFAPTLQGQFDYVVGNPPWVIPRRTPIQYTNNVREVVKSSKEDSIILEPSKKDFLVLKARSAAAEKQYFACVPFIWRALRFFSKKNGKIAFLMTSSMFSVIGAGGWRKWITNFPILKIIDMTLITDIHEGALCWSYIPVIVNKEKKSDNPIEYKFSIPLEKKDTKDWDIGLRNIKWYGWETSILDLPITKSRIFKEKNTLQPSDAPWIIAPLKVVKIIQKIQKNTSEANKGPERLGDLYPMHMGFKADGWKYFAFVELPKVENGIVKGKNLAGENIIIEEDFLFATSVASSLEPWKYTLNYAFLPIDVDGNQISEEEIKKYPLTWEYLRAHKRIFSNRAVLKKGYVKEWFGVLIPNAAKSTGKVVYRLIAKQLEASVLPSKSKIFNRKTLLLPDQSIRFIPMNSLSEANYLAGLMNSTILRSIAYLCVTPKGGVPWRAFKAWNVGFIPVIKYKDNEICRRISSLATTLSRKRISSEHYQNKLDKLVSELYGISEDEKETLKNHFLMMQGYSFISSDSYDIEEEDEELDDI